MTGLRLRGIGASPGGSPVLRAIDLEVPEGGRLVLVGPSGAGKTTLLRVVAGLEPPTAGRVEYAGEGIDGRPPHRRPIAMVFQEPRLFPNLDLADNVAFALRAAGIGRRERRARAEALLPEVGLDGLGGRSVRGLSGGEQQRVALARALCSRPRLLLLDEPTASVDHDRREALRKLILRLQRERGVTTLMVTHDRDEAAEMGERIALMIEGRIVQCDVPEELFLRPTSPAVARFFGVRNIVTGPVRDGRMDTPAGPLAVAGDDGTARVAIRPERISLGSGGRLQMMVHDATFLGATVRVRLAAGPMRLEAHVRPGTAPSAGAEVGVTIPTDAVWRFPEDEPVASMERDAARP